MNCNIQPGRNKSTIGKRPTYVYPKVCGRKTREGLSLSLSGEPEVTMVQELTEIEKLTENSGRNRE